MVEGPNACKITLRLIQFVLSLNLPVATPDPGSRIVAAHIAAIIWRYPGLVFLKNKDSSSSSSSSSSSLSLLSLSLSLFSLFSLSSLSLSLLSLSPFILF